MEYYSKKLMFHSLYCGIHGGVGKFSNFSLVLISFQSGNYLVLDNASIYVGSESWNLAIIIFEAAGVNLCFLSAYFPELNAA
jgi:hypothetical protein